MRLRAVLRRLALTTTPAQIEPPHDLVLQRLADGIYYERAGHPDRALACYGTVVGTATDPAVAIEALRHQSEVYRNLTQWELALESANAATMRAVLHRLPEAEMDGLNAEGAVYMAQGKFEVATEVFNEVAVAAKSARATGNALQNLASIVAQYGDFKKAHQLLNDAQSHHQTAGDVRGAAAAVLNLGRMLLDEGNVTGSLSLSLNARSRCMQLGDAELHAMATVNAADALRRMDRLDEAEQYAGEAMGHFSICRETRQKRLVYQILGDISTIRGHADVAARYYGRASEVAEALGIPRDVRLSREKHVAFPHSSVESATR